MKVDVERVIGECNTCNTVRRLHGRHESGHLHVDGVVAKQWALDFAGPMDSTSACHYMVVAVDMFSKFVVAAPCVSANARTVVEFFEEQHNSTIRRTQRSLDG